MKNTESEMKNTFAGLINRLDMAERRISELEDILIGYWKTEKQTEQSVKKKTRTLKDCGTTTKGVMHNANTRKRERKLTELIFETKMRVFPN